MFTSMGGGDSLLNLRSRQIAPVDKASVGQRSHCIPVGVEIMTLHHLRTIVVDSQPSERVYELLRRAGFDARPVEILDAQRQLHVPLPGNGPREQEGAGVAQMERAGGAGGQA